MRLDARMSTRILIVLALALAACSGHRSVGAGFPGDRSPHIWRGDGEDAGKDIVSGIVQTAVEVANDNGSNPPLCTPENESGDPPHTCPEKTGEQPAPK